MHTETFLWMLKRKTSKFFGCVSYSSRINNNNSLEFNRASPAFMEHVCCLLLFSNYYYYSWNDFSFVVVVEYAIHPQIHSQLNDLKIIDSVHSTFILLYINKVRDRWGIDLLNECTLHTVTVYCKYNSLLNSVPLIKLHWIPLNRILCYGMGKGKIGKVHHLLLYQQRFSTSISWV